MTNQDDMHIAEAVGYTFYLAYETDRITPTYNICWSPGGRELPDDKSRSAYRYTKMTIDEIDLGRRFAVTNPVSPFISAPTATTDQIVLEWVQGQEVELRDGFQKHLIEAIKKEAEIRPSWGFPNPLGQFLDYYKPGMYAQALLAVTEDKGDE